MTRGWGLIAGGGGDGAGVGGGGVILGRTFRKLRVGIFSYRSGMVNSNTINSKFHLIRSFFARFLSFHV